MKSANERINALHQWYHRNVMPWPLTFEVERRWLAFIKQGFNGHQLAAVIRYLRREISASRRNPGAIALTNLLEWGEDGVLTNFVKDLGLSQAQFRGRLEPAPETEGPRPAPPAADRTEPSAPLPPQATDEQRRAWAEELAAVRRGLRHQP